MKFSRPPTIKTADDFISGTTNTVREPSSSPRTTVAHEAVPVRAPVANAFPWHAKRSDKQTEVFNVRLTEVELEKLRYIAANTPDSMQAFFRKALLPTIAAKSIEITH